jgi:hypothetical protein
MKGKKKEQPEKTESSITRHVFRLPIAAEDKVRLEISGSTYEVVNLGARSAGILLEEENSLAAGQQLEQIVLHLGADPLHLHGRVVHVSPKDFQLICGIEFVRMTGAQENKLLDFLGRHRESMFGKR